MAFTTRRISHGEGIKLAQKRNETPVIIDWRSFVDMWDKYKSLPDALESKNKGIEKLLNGKLLMKRTAIKKISEKRKKLLEAEDILARLMLEECGGKCMLCGKYAILEKNHTRNRKRFILTCRECHFPAGYHRYLDDNVV